MIILFRNNLKAYSGWSFKGPYAPLGNQTPAHDHRAWLGIAWPGLARCGTAGAARCGTAGAAWQGTAGKGCCGAWQERRCVTGTRPTTLGENPFAHGTC